MKTEKTVVAHNGSGFFGGGEIWLCLLLAGLQRRGHRVLLLCKTPDIAARAESYGIRAEVFKIGGDVIVTDALRFARKLRRERPDAVLLTTFAKTWIGGMGARLARVPRVVARVAISTIAPRNMFHRTAITRWLDAVIVNADEVRSGFYVAMPKLAANKVITILDGIALPHATEQRGTVRAELGLDDRTRVIGTVARLNRQKRIDRLLQTLAELPDDVHCIIAGEGAERERLEALARKLAVSDRVHFLGFRSDIPAVLAALDIFVLASDSEGMANAMLEAMAAGLPVVSTWVSGTTAALSMDEDGVAPGIVTGFNVQELCKATRRLLDDKELRHAMGERGRQRVRERFSFERMVNEWEAVLFG